VVLNDGLGIAEDLDRAMQASVEAVAVSKDPWKEGVAPKFANQFAATIAGD
jgi:hypothetical protein